MTTTCDALWMGVPTVTLVGPTHVCRVGLGILSAVGLDDLLAYSPHDYTRLAVDLAHDKARPRTMRRSLRATMLASPLMDGKRLAGALGEADRSKWRRRCDGGRPIVI
jgi:predicted O-linked N-acetylglucosamine transferase (SPINDLY family)